jgi:hypothetical protein
MSTTKDNSQAIYNNYRAALRSMPHTVGSRAGERKQRALRLTSERYHVPISEVKKIVQNLEEENGISHDKDPNYLRKLERAQLHEKATEELLAAQRETLSDSGADPTCTTCGRSDKASLVAVRFNEVREAETGEPEFTLQCFPDWYYTSSIRGVDRD